MKLTTAQQAALEVLRAHKGRWVSGGAKSDASVPVVNSAAASGLANRSDRVMRPADNFVVHVDFTPKGSTAIWRYRLEDK